ncbi:MAG: hypothetical protein IH944_06145 [Armatimonadetes bacterium]|nr:hypothetical protein [Armatimonadota bacterium]
MFVAAVSIAILSTGTIDFYVDGPGFVRFVREGRSVYSRDVQLTYADSQIRHEGGLALNPSIHLGSAPDDLRVDLDGRLFGTLGESEVELGRIVLALFPDDVRPVVSGGFVVSPIRPKIKAPGTDGAGVIRMGKRPRRGVTARRTPNDADQKPRNDQWAGAPKIELLAEAVIDGNRIVLGQIATISASETLKQKIGQVSIGLTPAFGVSTRLSRDLVLLRLRSAFKDADAYELIGATSVTVKRKSQLIPHDRFVEAAIAAATQQISEDATYASTKPAPSMAAPFGEVELIAESVRSSGSTVTAVVALFVDGKRINSRTIKLDSSDPFGKIRIGQTVKVIVRSNAASVVTTGTVKGKNAAARTVTVRTATGAMLEGVVTAVGVVEVAA